MCLQLFPEHNKARNKESTNRNLREVEEEGEPKMRIKKEDMYLRHRVQATRLL